MALKWRKTEAAPGADIGSVTIGGDSVAVLTEGEMRRLAIAAPGGYVWRPSAGDSVLVLKTSDGESLAVGALRNESPEGMENGEVYIISKGGAAIRLKNSGKIELLGEVEIQGSLSINGREYSPCKCSGEG